MIPKESEEINKSRGKLFSIILAIAISFSILANLAKNNIHFKRIGGFGIVKIFPPDWFQYISLISYIAIIVVGLFLFRDLILKKIKDKNVWIVISITIIGILVHFFFFSIIIVWRVVFFTALLLCTLRIADELSKYKLWFSMLLLFSILLLILGQFIIPEKYVESYEIKQSELLSLPTEQNNIVFMPLNNIKINRHKELIIGYYNKYIESFGLIYSKNTDDFRIIPFSDYNLTFEAERDTITAWKFLIDTHHSNLMGDTEKTVNITIGICSVNSLDASSCNQDSVIQERDIPIVILK